MFSKSNFTKNESLQINTNHLTSLVESSIDENHVKPFNTMAKSISLDKLDSNCKHLFFHYKENIESALRRYNNLSSAAEGANHGGPNDFSLFYGPSEDEWKYAKDKKIELDELKNEFNRCIKK